MKKIVITGAAGLVGQNLMPMLVAEGYNITAIDRNPNLALLGRLNPSVQCLMADISSPGDWAEAFKDADIVIQLHAQIAAPNPEPFITSNVGGVQQVLAICEANSIRHLIHLSSSVVISVADDDYTRTKRAGEELVHHSRVPHTILRPPLMYGCFDAKHLGWLTRFMERSPIMPIPGWGSYFRQPLYVKDLCGVILQLCKQEPQNEVWNIIGHEKIPYIDLLKIIAKTRGWRRLFLPLPLPIFGFLLRVYGLITRKTSFTPDQMKALVAGDEFPVGDWSARFGVAYTPFREGMAQTWNSPCSPYAAEMVSPH
jgi:nucleoside-diphosphate-sugar epimerase